MKSTIIKKNKINTRELLLDSAFKTFYKYGFQGANIATILTEVGINKGSMYHFFKSKKELGLAVIEERIERNLELKYNQVFEQNESFKVLFNVLRSAPETLIYGCPLNKMSQEMLYLDEDFKRALAKAYITFESMVIKIVQQTNTIDVERKAKLIIATYEGALMSYHLNKNREEFQEILTTLERSISE